MVFRKKLFFYFERRVRRLLADNAEASEHMSITPDSQAMTRCPLAILKINKVGRECAKPHGREDEVLPPKKPVLAIPTSKQEPTLSVA